MAQVFRFVDSFGRELHKISDPQEKLPIPQKMQMVLIGHCGMCVESVSFMRTNSGGADEYLVRVRAVSLVKD